MKAPSPEDLALQLRTAGHPVLCPVGIPRPAAQEFKAVLGIAVAAANAIRRTMKATTSTNSQAEATQRWRKAESVAIWDREGGCEI